jgi:hypothetical protein
MDAGVVASPAVGVLRTEGAEGRAEAAVFSMWRRPQPERDVMAVATAIETRIGAMKWDTMGLAINGWFRLRGPRGCGKPVSLRDYD